LTNDTTPSILFRAWAPGNPSGKLQELKHLNCCCCHHFGAKNPFCPKKTERLSDPKRLKFEPLSIQQVNSPAGIDDAANARGGEAWQVDSLVAALVTSMTGSWRRQKAKQVMGGNDRWQRRCALLLWCPDGTTRRSFLSLQLLLRHATSSAASTKCSHH